MAVPSVVKPMRSIAELREMGPLVSPAAEAKRLEAILMPATDEEKLGALVFLFKILPMANEPDEASKRILMQGYMLAIDGYPKWAILEARDAFISGRVDGYASSFAPNPADLGREIARRVDADRERLSRARRQAEEQRLLGDDGPREPISEETRAMVARRLEELRAVSDEQRAVLSRKTGPDLTPYYKHKDEAPGISRPLTPEDVKDIPDAPPRARKTAFEPVGKFSPFGGKR